MADCEYSNGGPFHFCPSEYLGFDNGKHKYNGIVCVIIRDQYGEPDPMKSCPYMEYEIDDSEPYTHPLPLDELCTCCEGEDEDCPYTDVQQSEIPT